MALFDDEILSRDEIEEVREFRRESSKHQADWRGEARESYEYVSGEQWDPEDRAILETQQRPCVTFNRIGPMIDSVVGYEINNRREVKYKPRTMQDREVNHVFSEAARWVRQTCDAEDEESDAFRDCVITGMGWIETRVDYDNDPNGQIVLERVSPLEMRWDPGARKNNLADAKRLSREKWWALEDINAKWPDAEITPGEDDLANDNSWMDQHDATESWKYEAGASWWDPTEGKALVIQYQWCETEDYYEVADPVSGRVVEFDEERFERIKDKITLPSRKLSRYKYYQRFVCGETLLEEGPSPIDSGFSFHCITGKRDEENSVWYGLVRSMRDPQRWANSFFSTAMHSMMVNSKGGVITEKGAVGDYEQFLQRWADPRGVVEVEEGAITGGRIQERSMGGYPPALDKLMNFAIQGIRDVTGINMELLGMVGHEQSGMLEVERKKSALTILAPFINSVKRYRKMNGVALLTFMRKYLAPQTIQRITDRQVPFWEDDETVVYDVVVDDAPNSPNLKNEVWQAMQLILPAALRAGMPVPPDILKFSPLPDSVADSWVEYIQKQQQGPDPEQQQHQMQQMGQELQKLQKENMQLKDKRQAEAMQLQFKQREAEMDAMLKEKEMALEAKHQEMELTFKMQISDADRLAKMMEIEARYETEMARIEAQAEAQNNQARTQLQISRESSQAQRESQREQSVISLESEREKRKVVREEKQLGELNPHVKQIEHTDQKVDDLVDKMTTHQEDMKSQRKKVLNFLKSRGGAVAELARNLDD